MFELLSFFKTGINIIPYFPEINEEYILRVSKSGIDILI
jgi:hypothetical protein